MTSLSVIKWVLVLLAVSANAEALELTHYGYETPGQPYYDTNSYNGIGAFNFDTAPGSLQAINATGVTAAALSPDVAAQYGLTQGQQFTITTSSGQTMVLEYADSTASDLTGRIDLYDPSGTFQQSGMQVTSVQGGPVLATPQSGAGAVVAATVNMAIVDPLLKQFQSAGSKWASAITGAATWLFWILATISLAWTCICMAIKQADLMEFCAELVRFIMFTGLFFWLLTNGATFANDIVKSLWKIGGNATGNGQAIFPGDLVTMGLQVFTNAITHVNFLNPGTIVGPVLVALGIMVVCTLIACNMILLLCASWIVLYAGLIFLGFGGCRWTSDMAVNYYRTVISIGVSLMTMELIIGMGEQFLQNLVTATSQTPTAAALAGVLCAAIILAVISHKIPHMVAGMAVGGGHNGAIGSIGVLSLLGAGFAGARLAGAMGAAGPAGAAASAAAAAKEKLMDRISGVAATNGNGASRTDSSYNIPGTGSSTVSDANTSSRTAAQVTPSAKATSTMRVEAEETDDSDSELPDDFLYPDEPV